MKLSDESLTGGKKRDALVLKSWGVSDELILDSVALSDFFNKFWNNVRREIELNSIQNLEAELGLGE